MLTVDKKCHTEGQHDSVRKEGVEKKEDLSHKHDIYRRMEFCFIEGINK
jgi:hypothetical protein